MQPIVNWCIALALFVALPATAATHERAVYTPRPAYPQEARTRHLTGEGAFVLHIKPNGTVDRVETTKSIGYALLDRAAIAALQNWRFKPHTTTWTLHIPIRYIDGPVRIDAAMTRSSAPGWGELITVFSGRKP